MSEERPVPRRESPWGLPEGDKRQPKAHRCNDRVEDVVQACFEGNPFKTVPGPFRLFWRCMRSKPGVVCVWSPMTSLLVLRPKEVWVKTPMSISFSFFSTMKASLKREEPTEPFTYLQLDPPKRVEINLE